MPDTQEAILYAVTLTHSNGDKVKAPLRWRKWIKAANFGEFEVRAGRAKGFHISSEKTDDVL